MSDRQETEMQQPMTTEYGVHVAEVSPRGSRRTALYWTPDASSPEEAIEIAAREYDEVTSSVESVRERTVPAPEGWFE